MYLLDAHWVVSFLNGRTEAVTLIARLGSAGLFLSVIAWGEIYEGLLSKPDPERHVAMLDEFVARIELFAPDICTARHYAEIRKQLRAAGRMIPDNDLWIAATALAHDLTLVSRDRHFERVPSLKLYQQP